MTVKIYDDHKLNDITDSLVVLKNTKNTKISDKALSLLNLDKASKLKRTINSDLDRLHFCMVDGDLSNEITEKDDESSFNNILLGLNEELNPIYLNGLDKHLMITGGSGRGKSYLLFKLLKETIKSGCGLTLVTNGREPYELYSRDFFSICGLDEKKVTFIDLNDENSLKELELFDFNEAFSKGQITVIRMVKKESNPLLNLENDKTLWSLLFKPIAKTICELPSKVNHVIALDEMNWGLADGAEYIDLIETSLTQARSAGISLVIANQPHSSLKANGFGGKLINNIQTKIDFSTTI